MKTVILTCTFVDVVYSSGKGGRKQVSRTPTDVKVVFEGRNKTHCRQQAKENFRSGVEWEHHYETPN